MLVKVLTNGINACPDAPVNRNTGKRLSLNACPGSRLEWFSKYGMINSEPPTEEGLMARNKARHT